MARSSGDGAAQHAAEGSEEQHAEADEQAHDNEDGKQHQAQQTERQAQQRVARLAGLVGKDAMHEEGHWAPCQTAGDSEYGQRLVGICKRNVNPAFRSAS